MSTHTLATRTFNDTPIPSAGSFSFDPVHSYVGFSVRHLMVARVRGRFGAVTGTVVIGEDPLDTSIEASIEATSVDTHDVQRDAHLRSPDFFDVERHPLIAFTSHGLRPAGAGRVDVDGLLTVKGTSRPVTLAAEVTGVGVDPWGNERGGISARAEIDREEWGFTWNQTLDTGGLVIGRSISLEIEAEIVRS